MNDDHQSFIKSPRQLIVVIVLAFLVPIIVITLFATLVETTTRTGMGTDSMSPESIAQRLEPIGRVEFQGAPSAQAAQAAPAQAESAQDQAAAPAPASPVAGSPAPTAPAAGAAPASQAAAASSADGEKIYKSSCAMCHDAGVAGAPKQGDVAAWKPRLEQGADTLKKHAIEGIRAMPPRGGNASLSDAQVHAAVDFMVSTVQ